MKELSAKAFQAFSPYVIPILVGIAGACSRFWSRMFIRDEKVQQNLGDHLSYLLTGQSTLICPLILLVNALNKAFIGHRVSYLSVFMLALYLGCYILAVAYYLSLTPTHFQNAASSYVRCIYKAGPIALVLVSVMLDFLKMTGKLN